MEVGEVEGAAAEIKQEPAGETTIMVSRQILLGDERLQLVTGAADIVLEF